MKKAINCLIAAILVISTAACSANAESNISTEQETQQNNQNTTLLQSQMPKEGDEIAIIQTNKGEIRMQFFPEQAPKAVENFKTHAKEGYFDGLIFHRVINNFMIQGGDPTGTGAGGESIWKKDFEDEPSNELYFFRGAVAMANRGPNTNGSQFFIVQNNTVVEQMLQLLKESKTTENDGDNMGIYLGEKFISINEMKNAFTDAALDFYEQNGGSIELESVFSGSVYTIFGQVYSGLDTVDAIAVSETDSSDKPVEDIIIEKITIEQYHTNK
ncbi:peptidylprolyl isomerase [Lachnospiraceae bacterium 46-61]